MTFCDLWMDFLYKKPVPESANAYLGPILVAQKSGPKHAFAYLGIFTFHLINKDISM